MGHFNEFAQTLEKKIRRQIEEEFFGPQAPRMTQAEVHDELPLGYAWLLGQEDLAQKHTLQKQKAHSAYGVRPKPARPHHLNAEQTQAFELFQRLGAVLTPAFNRDELKSAWKKAARATHPDFGGDGAAFGSARAAWLVLQTVFPAKTGAF